MGDTRNFTEPRTPLGIGGLHDLPPIDRYCFMPCSDQILTGMCDCTRRIDREIIETFPPHDHTIEPGEINRRGCERCQLEASLRERRTPTGDGGTEA